MFATKLTLGGFYQFRSGFDVSCEELDAFTLFAVNTDDEWVSPLGGSTNVDRTSRDLMRTALVEDTRFHGDSG